MFKEKALWGFGLGKDTHHGKSRKHYASEDTKNTIRRAEKETTKKSDRPGVSSIWMEGGRY